ncbi:MAG TPA: mechanosensitive ion channel domain-containing protein [Chitinophagaceae bacterium]|nr:mechanosensitive ion channel domain-containing protein [Chitinophagaceae bacterium]
MNKLLHTVILDNTVLSYLICFGSILLALLLKKYLSQYIAGIFFRLLQRTTWKIEKASFIDLILAPLQSFFIILIAFIALDKLHFPKALVFDIHRITSKQIIDSIGTGLIIASFIWLLLRSIDFVALVLGDKTSRNASVRDNQLIVFFRDFLKVIIGIIGILLVIQFSFNKDIGALLAGFGIVGAALALAAKESLENLIASFIIFFDKPFTVGDLVKVQAITGTVERIGLRSTRIRTDAKTYVTMPNKQMVDSIMDNLTLRTQRRADLRLEISLSTTPEQLQQLLQEIQRITDDPPVVNKTIALTDISSHAYIITVEYYTSAIPFPQFSEARQHVNLEIIKAMAALQVELAGLNTEVKLSGSLAGVQASNE